MITGSRQLLDESEATDASVTDQYVRPAACAQQRLRCEAVIVYTQHRLMWLGRCFGSTRSRLAGNDFRLIRCISEAMVAGPAAVGRPDNRHLPSKNSRALA